MARSGFSCASVVHGIPEGMCIVRLKVYKTDIYVLKLCRDTVGK